MLKCIMQLNRKELPDNPAELKKIINSMSASFDDLNNSYSNLNDSYFELNNSYSTLNNSYSELNRTHTEIIKENKNQGIQIKHLEEQLRLLRNKLFSRKSEKYNIPKEEEQQSLLFNEIETQGEEKEEEKKVTVPEHKKKKGGRKPIPDWLPVEEKIIDVPEEEKKCSCGKEYKEIGQEEIRKVDIIPPRIKVIKEIRKKYAQNCDCVETGKPAVITAPLPPALIPKSIVTPGFISYILISKFCDHIPLYRQEKILARYEIEITRQKMSFWLIKISEMLRPLQKYLKEALLKGDLMNIDETPVQVMKEPGRKNTEKSYMWCYRGGPPDKRVIIFQYDQSRAGKVCREFISGYRGSVVTDDHPGYGFIEKEVDMTHYLCWAHVRRKFENVIKAAKKGSGKKEKTGHAGKALSYIGKLYKIEEYCRENKLIKEQIKEKRRKESVPIIKEFKAWLDGIYEKVVPKSLLGIAVKYTMSNWEKLEKYAETGHVPMDNNGAENAIRPFVVGRKNWLFSGAPRGAEASALYYSLIETAKANGLEPYYYMRYLLEKALNIKDETEFKELLPQNIDKEEFAEFINKSQVVKNSPNCS